MNPCFVAAAVAAPLLLAACTPRAATPPGAPSPSDDARVCTMEFRTFAVRVEAPGGVPVTDARIDVRRADGTSVVCTADGQTGCVQVREFADPQQPHFYTIMTDGVPIARTGETITVNATANGRTVAGVYRFAHDGCHVGKVSGPDVLTLAR